MRWNTTAVHHCGHQRYKSGRCSPCRQMGTHRADLQSCHHKLERVHLGRQENMYNKYHYTTAAFTCWAECFILSPGCCEFVKTKVHLLLHCSQLTPLPRQVQIICLVPWLLIQRWPMKYVSPASVRQGPSWGSSGTAAGWMLVITREPVPKMEHTKSDTAKSLQYSASVTVSPFLKSH